MFKQRFYRGLSDLDMYKDAFVLDVVAHPFNFHENNYKRGKLSKMFVDNLYTFHRISPPDQVLSPAEYYRNWDLDSFARTIFLESSVDLAVAHPLPLDDFFHDGLADVKRCCEAARKYPGRFIAWGTVNPLLGDRAIEQLEWQVKECGVKAIKLYQTRYDYGKPLLWRADDDKVAYPIYEAAKELGVRVVAFHKGFAFSVQPVEHTALLTDVEAPLSSFPELNFVVFHVGFLTVDEVVWMMYRYENLWVSIAGSINFGYIAPEWFGHVLGKVGFFSGGYDRVIWGSEFTIFHPEYQVRWFMDSYQIPENLVKGYGYPQLTEEDKKKILGLNAARLMGINVDEALAKVRNDEFESRRSSGLLRPWSVIRGS